MTHLSRRRVLASLGSALGWSGAFGWSALRQGQDDASPTFGAWLTGVNQVPPVETDAFGFAVFRVAQDGSTIDYWLVVADVEDVTESHVHKGPPDFNGNAVAYLLRPVEEPVSQTGLLASGTVTDEDVIWPLTEVPGMVEQMRAENVYVNVHTTEHPAGEIRGQIRALEV